MIFVFMRAIFMRGAFARRTPRWDRRGDAIFGQWRVAADAIEPAPAPRHL
jgi:hypothetical protein